MYPCECSQPFSEMLPRCGIGSCELWALNKVNCSIGVGLASECRWIEKRCEHALEGEL